jgi:hypothetical protein
MNTNTDEMMSNFLEDLEGVLVQYFGEDWTYERDETVACLSLAHL